MVTRMRPIEGVDVDSRAVIQDGVSLCFYWPGGGLHTSRKRAQSLLKGLSWPVSHDVRIPLHATLRKKAEKAQEKSTCNAEPLCDRLPPVLR